MPALRRSIQTQRAATRTPRRMAVTNACSRVRPPHGLRCLETAAGFTAGGRRVSRDLGVEPGEVETPAELPLPKHDVTGRGRVRHGHHWRQFRNDCWPNATGDRTVS